MLSSYSLYIHIPFCRHRCAYCDFNTYAGMDNLVEPYTEALCREIALASAAGTTLPVHTLFFGGGTPSLLSTDQLSRIIETVHRYFQVSSNVEITLEANPGTVSLESLRDMRSLGINRLSMGMQSASPEELRLLERTHDYLDVANAVRWARLAGFDNLNLDLIFGLPYQRLESWQRSVDLALALQPEHLSLYSLILEHGTPMNAWVERGLLNAPDEDAAAEMYEWTIASLPALGYEQYEISNWARRVPGKGLLAARHNLQYWRNLPYLGLGAGAHGCAAGFRTANVRGPAAYIKRCLEGPPREFPQTPATVNAHPVDRRGEMQETMMVGLRLTQEGVSNAAFRQRFGQDIAGVFPGEVAPLLAKGLIEWVGDALRLTARGVLLGNQVFMEFV